MHAVTFLITEHKRLRAGIHALEEQVVRNPGAAFAALATDLVIHAGLEEEYLYPLLEKLPELREGAKHAYHEHHLLDVQIDELAVLDPTSPAWAGKLHVLRETLTHHLDEEEEDVFPKMAKQLPAVVLEQLADSFADYRRTEEKRLSEQPPTSAQAEALHRIQSHKSSVGPS